ncbi:hypothetical protein CSUI_005614 [Cystoisospora suis]|uniref:Uncharacterized protein n=1 Tax=Cystoisospora suis TaxID=483139 RepID=A0A2C6KX03_9APIC|nr:hypothetical protein CSUI_005614 [Cystoisospora suis]
MYERGMRQAQARAVLTNADGTAGVGSWCSQCSHLWLSSEAALISRNFTLSHASAAFLLIGCQVICPSF